MDDQLAEALQRLTAVEKDIEAMKERLNRGIAAWQFWLLLLASIANAAGHFVKLH